ncbi:MAG: aspartate kinase, partial [Muribaculaceae bacterium]|nr:aspartate kinase [Muribaculaceae bacterium]
MKVLKFGGTSVGSVESLRNVKSIVESIDDHAVVIVSALGGLTDQLIATAKSAAANDLSYLDSMKAITARHINIIENVVAKDLQKEVNDKVSALLSDLERLYAGVYLIRHLPQMTLDIIVSFGERLSSIIVAAMIDGGSHHDSLGFIKTEKWYEKNIADQKLTTELIRKEFSRPFKYAIVPGFISTDIKTGDITNLGRGGSDFTAALVAAALNAEVLEIWTDVDGFLSADPRIVPDAILIPHMSFIESMELCSYGAKVIYPPTIYPVFHKNIPIKILNTFNPSAKGTLITDSQNDGDLKVKGISAIRDTSLFHIDGNISGKLKN